ncbi:toxin secretion/phage lysis holin [[Clostridium] polysaccharolyticum]|uniref:Toxin secretion/phage lysis holin n=2 Tax=[Clostridium] polysaccharolyticum TaxID=29364 RepID=A0A1H9YH12_9FIRM|nr:toxin secretion/phage lysis holin [[Clostridium] polysaccharolyticum]
MCAIVGVTGGAITNMLGGWDSAIITMLVFMALDYLSGIVVAGVFKKSTKTDSGALNSSVGWKGLCRKGMMLAFVLVANRLDIAIGTVYIRDAVVMAFTCNEAISITENSGLMGVPIPNQIVKAIEVLKNKEERTNEN